MNGKFIGTTIAKKITVNILNPNNLINLENKTIEVYTGIKIGETLEEIPLGTFIIEKPESEETEEKTTFVGYDYMIKFNKEYVDSNTYPISLKQYLTNLCSQVGLELGLTKLTNENYQILGNPFTEENKVDCKTVLSKVAELCGGFAKIGRDNKLYIVNLNSNEYIKALTVNEVHHMKVSEINSTLVKYFGKTQGVPSSATIDGNTYMKFKKNNMYGEVNSLVLKLSQVEGENDAEVDEASITANGLTEIVIEDNPFLINSEERKKVIKELWKALKGLKYLPFKLDEYYGFPYLDTGDKIEILDTEDTEYVSFVFEHKFTYNGAFKGLLNTEALTKTQTEYKNLTNMKTRFRKVELVVDKINGKISTIIEQQDEQETKISKIVQDINEITSTVATKDELNETKSEIKQTTDEITSTVSKKVGNDEIISKINQSAEKVQINANKISLEGKQINLTAENITFNSTKFSVDKNGKVTCSDITATGGTIGGFTLGTTQFTGNLDGIYNYNSYDRNACQCMLLEMLSSDAILKDIFDANSNGSIGSDDLLTIQKILLGQATSTKNVKGTIKINSNDPKNTLIIQKNGTIAVSIGVGGVNTNLLTVKNFICGGYSSAASTNYNVITGNGETATLYFKSSNSTETTISPTQIVTPKLTQTSVKSKKKNIKKFTENALELIKNADICLYNFKNEKTGTKKHIGLVIGEGYNCPDEVISEDRQGVEQYSMVSLTYKAIQELDKRLTIVEENKWKN